MAIFFNLVCVMVMVIVVLAVVTAALWFKTILY